MLEVLDHFRTPTGELSEIALEMAGGFDMMASGHLERDVSALAESGDR